jgi:eukaryotic-like serine/threonine-protein kinase
MVQLSASDLSALNVLLDEALEIPAHEVEAWLASLPVGQRHLADRLRSILIDCGRPGHSRFMRRGPMLDDANEQDKTVPQAGEPIGPYRLIRQIGRGGMGTVWLADRVDGSFERHVAVKLPRLAWGEGLAERMARERRITALLEHPHIARLYDAGIDAVGRPYLAFEYVEGEHIDAWCKARSATVSERLRLFLQIACAVAYAHTRLVVHRDIKPSNVLVTADGQARLLDFGIAKLLHQAAEDDELTVQLGRVLTPQYASPEQLRGEPITVSTDVYSLGVLLYLLLSGAHPYAREGSAAALDLDNEPPLASQRTTDKTRAQLLRGEIDAILAKALRRAPHERYPTADAFASDVQRHLCGEVVLARPHSVLYRAAKLLSRHRVAFSALGAVLLAVSVGAGVAVGQARRATEAADRAQVVKQFVIDVFRVNAHDDPAKAEVRQLPAEELLDRGARLIESRFAGQVALQAELYGVVATTFDNMGSAARASTYAAKQVDALDALHASDADTAGAVTLLSRSLIAQGQFAAAETHAKRALGLAGADVLLATRARMALMEAVLAQGYDDEAMLIIARIEGTIDSKEQPLTTEKARAQMLRANLMTVHRRFKQAVETYERAIRNAESAGGPMSQELIEIRLHFIKLLISRSMLPQAKAQLQAALRAMRALGGPSDFAAAMTEAEATKLLAESGEGSLADGIATLSTMRAKPTAYHGTLSDVARARLDYWIGSLLYDWGDLDKAYALINESVPVLQQNDQNLFERRARLALLGTVALDTGRISQASQAWRDALDLGQSLDSKRSGRCLARFLAAREHAGLARTLLAQGNLAEAEALLRSVPINTFVDDVNTLNTMLGIVKLDQDDASAALSLVATLDPTGSPFLDPRAVRAQAMCRTNRANDGWAQLEALTARAAEGRSPNHPAVARMRAETGLCALAAGHRARAEALAKQAREALQHQPSAGVLLKRPLQELGRRLGQVATAAQSPDAGRSAGQHAALLAQR